MNKDAVEDELLSPPGLGAQLISYGLVPVELMSEEFFLAEEYGPRYKTLSVYDRIALAIAKNRKITLLTGDSALRKAAIRTAVSAAMDLYTARAECLWRLYDRRYAAVCDLRDHRMVFALAKRSKLQL
jgi:hypothetical protein